MSVDKLVDSTQLDSDLTSVANAIRTKGGTSSQLAFPSGFVSAINDIPTGGGGSVTQDQDGYIVIPSTGSGGSNFESGTFTPASNTSNFEVSVSFEPSSFLCSTPKASITGTDNTWKMQGFCYLNSTDGGFDFLRYGATNNSAQTRNANLYGYSNGKFTHTGYGNFLAGVTYTWAAW